jgi:plastocyanin domain-containing protein
VRLVAALLFVAGTAIADPTRLAISITKRGFDPDRVTVKKDEEVVLAFTRKTDATCAKEVTIDLGDGTKVTKELPLDKTVEVRAVFHKTGELRYACSMDMLRGTIAVQ